MATRGQGGGTSNRGFASMDPAKQRAIAAEGGRAAHAQGVAHEFDSEEARAAGRKGGQARSHRSAMAAMSKGTMSQGTMSQGTASQGTAPQASTSEGAPSQGTSLASSGAMSAASDRDMQGADRAGRDEAERSGRH